MIEKEIDGIEKMIDSVILHYPIAKQKVYLAGLSAGAVFCHFLANRRPYFYNGIISHSQAYASDQGTILEPAVKGPQFGVIFAYNKNDYETADRILHRIRTEIPPIRLSDRSAQRPVTPMASVVSGKQPPFLASAAETGTAPLTSRCRGVANTCDIITMK